MLKGAEVAARALGVRLPATSRTLRPVDTRELAGLRVPGEEARDEEAGADVEEERAPGHVRFTVMRSWAPQVRSSLTAGWPTLWTRTRAFLPPAVV